MRQLSLVFGVGAVVAAVAASASTAYAAPGKEGTKQATVPTSSAAETQNDTGGLEANEAQTNGLRLLPQGANPDLINNDRVEQKAWTVGGGFETHHLVRQEDLEGQARYKQFNVLGLYAQYDFSQYDRVRVSGYVDEYFLADQGETGFRLDDIFLQYQRRVPLPHQFTLRASVQTSIPTSYQSTLTSEITSPGATLSLEKKFGRYVDVNGRGTGTLLIDKYATAYGGSPNARASVSLGGSISITMPFHEPLSLGFDGGTGYTWFYQPNNTTDQNPSVQANGTVGDPQFSSQPISQSYFGEITLDYILPTFFGVRSDLLVAYADGDPTIGSISVLHDGVGHFYGFFRDSSEVYAAINAAY
jgi:hypothetical protein